MASATSKAFLTIFVILATFYATDGTDEQELGLESVKWIQSSPESAEWLQNQFGTRASCDESSGECEGTSEESFGEHGRLLWGRRRYYISYGALIADSVPCRPRSGRSYYTANCRGAGGPVRPYRRGCSVITRCYRFTG